MLQDEGALEILVHDEDTELSLPKCFQIFRELMFVGVHDG